MYAIIETGGKQYRVRPGQTFQVEKLAVEDGDTVELDRVLLVNNDEGQVTVGTPTVEGAKVIVDVAGHGRGKKIIVFKYKPKTRYRRKSGHRQSYTELWVKEIVTAEGQVPAASDDVAAVDSEEDSDNGA